MTYLTCTAEGMIYSGTAYVGHISKHIGSGEVWLVIRDGYTMNTQILLELHHILKAYNGE